jgi:hypothetical protein
MRRPWFIAALALAAVACLDFNNALSHYCPGACADGGTDGGLDFTLSFNPSSVVLVAGGTQTVQLTVTRGTYAGDVAVALSQSSLPPQVTATSTTVVAGSTTGSLTLSAASTAPSASSTATVTATGDRTKSFSLPVAVTGLWNLTVDLVGVPSGTSPSVTVAGPNNYTNSLTGTTALTGLVAGNYTVTASAIRSTDSIVASWYKASVTGSSVVNVGQTSTVTVTYTVQQGSGHLWIVDNGAGKMLGYSASQLHTVYPRDAGPVAADVQLTVDPTSQPEPYSPAFDSSGDLWLAVAGSLAGPVGQVVYHYSQTQLATGSVVPRGRIAFPGWSPEALAFDKSGDLWVADGFQKKALYKLSGPWVSDAGYFSADGGVPTPIPLVTIQAVGPYDLTNSFIAFDSAGNLYATRSDFVFGGTLASSRLLKFTPNQLTHSGTLTPAATIYVSDSWTPDGGLANPQGIVFDKNGYLWITNYGWDPNGGSPQVIKISPTDLQSAAGTTTVAAITHLVSPDLSLYGAAGIALDESGDLWVSSVAAPVVYEFQVGALTTPGFLSLSPDNILASTAPLNLPFFVEMVFAPSAPGTPLAY